MTTLLDYKLIRIQTQDYFLDENFNYEVFLNESEKFLQEISISSIKNTFEDRLNKSENIIAKYGVSLDKIKKFTTDIKSKILKMYDDGLSSEEAANKITQEIRNKFGVDFQNIKKQIQKLGVEDKVGIAIMAIMTVIIIQSILVSVIAIFTSMKVGMIIAATIFAPITEEAMKTYFITQNMEWSGTAIFAGYEALGYIVMLVMNGISLSKAVMARAIAFVFHMLTTLTQKKIVDFTVKKDDSEQQKQKKLAMAWFVGTLMHSTWNTMAVMTIKK